MTHRRPKGFTLLELLIALAVVGVAAGALFASMRIVFRARTAVENATDSVSRAGIALDFLKRDLESTLPPGPATAVNATLTTNVSGTNYRIIGDFIGTDGQDDRGGAGDDLAFYAATDTGSADTFDTDVRLVEYTLVSENGEHKLVRYVTSNILAPVAPDPVAEVLCRNVLEFNIRYFDGTDWYDSWDSSQNVQQNTTGASGTGVVVNAIGSTPGTTTQIPVLPYAVEITLTFEPKTPGADPQVMTRLILIPCSGLPSTDTLTGTGGGL